MGNVFWRSNTIKHYLVTTQNGKPNRKICLVTKQCLITFDCQTFLIWTGLLCVNTCSTPQRDQWLLPWKWKLGMIIHKIWNYVILRLIHCFFESRHRNKRNMLFLLLKHASRWLKEIWHKPHYMLKGKNIKSTLNLSDWRG